MVNIGDQYQIGSSRLVVTQPRMPCYKLGIKFGRMDILEKFVNSQRPGIYYKVLKEGELGAGDNITLLYRDKNNVTINDIVSLYINDRNKRKYIKNEKSNKIRIFARTMEDLLWSKNSPAAEELMLLIKSLCF